MNLILVALCAVLTFVSGDLSLRQTDPGGHTPSYDKPQFLLDERNEVIAIMTTSGCYLYHLTDLELESASDPGGLDSMEHTLVTELRATKSFPVVSRREFHHLNHNIRQMCQNPKTFDIHDVRKPQVVLG